MSDRPTITYSPQTGAEFTRISSIRCRLAAVLNLIEGATRPMSYWTWPSIDQRYSQSPVHWQVQPADPEFHEVVQIMKKARPLARSVCASCLALTKEPRCLMDDPDKHSIPPWWRTLPICGKCFAWIPGARVQDRQSDCFPRRRRNRLSGLGRAAHHVLPCLQRTGPESTSRTAGR